MGLMEDKVIKNHFASEYIYNKYKDLKTCDVIEDNPQVRLHTDGREWPVAANAAAVGSVPCKPKKHLCAADRYTC